jgi:hypothetical protein
MSSALPQGSQLLIRGDRLTQPAGDDESNNGSELLEQSSLERKYMPKATRLAVLHSTLVA